MAGNWGIVGTFDREAAQQGILAAAVEAWLRFSSGFLCSHCPDDLRIVSYAAIQAEASELSHLDRILEDYGWQPWCTQPAFWLSVMPPLGKVSKQHLRHFLVNGHTSCDPGLYRDIVQCLIDKTSGDFEPTIDLIQKAENGTWRDLLAQLRREQGGNPTKK